jgi:hypothetical protein
MIEREKGKDNEIVKEKTLGQPIAIKKKKGSKMAMGKRKQHRQIGRRKPYKGRGSFVFFCTKVIYK